MIANLYPYLPRMFGRCRQEAFLQNRIARTQQRQLSTLLQQTRQRFKHQVEAFLAGQTAYHRKQRHLLVDL
ncbi:hypothetical protein D3C79_1078590 [compost metagenome]